MSLSNGVLPDALFQAMGVAFEGNKRSGSAVSLAGVREKVRQNYPECTLSDEKLNTAVGDYAIQHGYNVNFDGRLRQTSIGSNVAAK